MCKVSVIVGFRNRDIERIKISLNSLANQLYQDFEVIFIDYGSEPDFAQEVQRVVNGYKFVRYFYSDTRGWYWNRAHALNTGVKVARGEILIFFDIDLILAEDFFVKLLEKNFGSDFYTFNCFYLPQGVVGATSELISNSHNYSYGYVGLSAVLKSHVEKIGGIDEYYMVWGVEDDDFYKRLVLYGLTRHKFGLPDFKLFHQWHPLVVKDPSFWLLTMTNRYFNTERLDGNSDWGKIILPESRSINLENIAQLKSGATQILLNKRSNIRYLNFWEVLNGLQSGEVAYFDFYLQDHLVPRINFTSFLRKFLITLVSCGAKSVATNQNSNLEVLDFLEFFIGVHRPVLRDYYFSRDEKGLSLILIKA